MLIGHRTILNSLLNPNKSRTFNLKRFYSPPIFKSTDHAFKDRNMNITESALSRLVELKQKFPESRLRLAVEAGGCHGFQYKFQLDIEEPSSEDITFQDTSTSSSLQIICDKTSWPLLKDAKLDFAQELIGSAFRIVDNPVADSGCGCGVSFDLKSNK